MPISKISDGPCPEIQGAISFDHQHAAAAVGYCDAFFTERSLANILTRSDLALDKLYDCTVVSTPEAALQYARSVI